VSPLFSRQQADDPRLLRRELKRVGDLLPLAVIERVEAYLVRTENRCRK
jgi:hypothetical protein